MIGLIKKAGAKISNFRSETGAATVEFVFIFPFWLGLFLSAYEVAIMNTRAVLMEKAMDVVVREIRLGTGKQINYDGVLEEACRQAALIPYCMDALKMELKPIDKDTWSGITHSPDCVRRDEPVQTPVRFENGQENEIMLIRLCAVVDPVFGGIGVGRSMPRDPSGEGYQIIATSAFVNEPQ